MSILLTSVSLFQFSLFLKAPKDASVMRRFFWSKFNEPARIWHQRSTFP